MKNTIQSIFKTFAFFSTVNPKEMNQFQNIKGWWSPAGPSQLLYQYNYHRLAFLKQHIKPNSLLLPLLGLKILDVGCGAGFLSESMGRLGAKVIGLDPNITSYTEAIAHQKGDTSLESLSYFNMSVEQYFQQNPSQVQTFDIVTSMQVIEHVDNKQKFLKQLSMGTKMQGLIMVSTIQRNISTLLKHIIFAQYILGIVPKGTHDHSKFINADELHLQMDKIGIREIDRLSLNVNISGQLKPAKDGQNYLLVGRKVRRIDEM